VNLICYGRILYDVSRFEKRAHSAQRPKFLFLIVHNFKAVIATDLKPRLKPSYVRLKTVKFLRFVQSGPFSQIRFKHFMLSMLY